MRARAELHDSVVRRCRVMCLRRAPFAGTFAVAMLMMIARPCSAKRGTSYGVVQVTEICYEQPDASSAIEGDVVGSNDWVEIYNPSKTVSVDLTGFALTDLSYSELRKKRPETVARHWFKIPKLVLAPKSFAVIARDEMEFRKAYAGHDQAIEALVRGSFGFGLNNKGETLRILDTANETVFELKYKGGGKGPWPDTREGGHSLELIDARLDPNDPYSWIASLQSGGTPGEVNSVAVAW